MTPRGTDLPGLLSVASAYAAAHTIGDDDPGSRALAATAAAVATRSIKPQPLAAYLDRSRPGPPAPFAASLATLRSLAATPVPQVVAGSGGAVRTTDLLAWTRAELVATWLAAGGEPPKPELVAAARTIAAVLAARHPGRTIEVRVPPAVAVQIGFGRGPSHTRGTPPNVVETDPATFVRLAAGALEWPDALATGVVRASGDAADLGPALPVSGLGQSAAGGSASV